MRVILILSLLFSNLFASAEFLSARIKVIGLTCSMCSKSVHNALSSIDFIDSVAVDLESTEFKVFFKTDKNVVIDKIKQKIEDAGFSIGEMNMTFKFSDLAIHNDTHHEYQDNLYHFVNVKEQTLKGITNFKIIDKGFVSSRDFKKYVKLTTYNCIKTGRTSACCKTGKEGTRIYHITI